MGLREQFTDQLKASMKAGDAPRTSTLRMILARLKDIDIAARPKGIDRVPDEEIVGMLRGMVKSRRESVELYRQGHRPGPGRQGRGRDRGHRELSCRSRWTRRRWQAAVAAAIAETGRGQHQGHGQGDGRAAGEARRDARHGEGRADGEGAAVVMSWRHPPLPAAGADPFPSMGRGAHWTA